PICPAARRAPAGRRAERSVHPGGRACRGGAVPAAGRSLAGLARRARRSPRFAALRLGVDMAILQDLRFSLRALCRSPWFTLTAVAMLSVGLGLCMYMFGAIQSFALRPPPFPNGERLLHIEYRHAATGEDSI